MGNIIIYFVLALAWEQLPTPTFYTLYSIYFLSTEKGFAVGNNGVVLKTEDGGNTWEYMDIGAEGFTLRDIIFLNSTEGFIVGHSLSAGILSKTSDGGDTWSSEIKNIGKFYSCDFIDSDTGFIGGEGANPPCYITNDGGENFSIEFVSQTLSGKVFDVHMFNEIEGFCIVKGISSSEIERRISINNWQTVYQTVGILLYNFSFVPGGVGYAVGSSGTVLKFDGNTWMNLTFPYNEHLVSVFAVDENHIFLSGIGPNSFYHSVDGGNTWLKDTVPSNFGINDTIYSLFYINGVVFACGTGGKILRTSLMDVEEEHNSKRDFYILVPSVMKVKDLVIINLKKNSLLFNISGQRKFYKNKRGIYIIRFGNQRVKAVVF
jgi:photosystem II stability/assembly factor-like uncharacterized protein